MIQWSHQLGNCIMTTRLITTIEEAHISLDQLRSSPVYKSDDDLNYIITALKVFKAHTKHIKRLFGITIPSNMAIMFDNELLSKDALGMAWIYPDAKDSNAFAHVHNRRQYDEMSAISLSMTWLRKVPNETFNDTIPHELAHVVVDRKGFHSEEGGGHGFHWVEAMKALGIHNPRSKFNAAGMDETIQAHKQLYKKYHV